MDIEEFVYLTRGEIISHFNPDHYLGEWVRHVFAHYSNDHRLNKNNVFSIRHKNDSRSVNTRFITFKNNHYILIDEDYLDEIIQISNCIYTGEIKLGDIFSTSSHQKNEFDVSEAFDKDMSLAYNIFPDIGSFLLSIDSNQIEKIVREIIMKFMIAHEIHHVLVDNGFIHNELKYDFESNIGFEVIDDAIDLLKKNPIFSNRLTDDYLLLELCCDRHAIDLTWRDVIFSRGECNPLLFSSAIIVAFSAMKFYHGNYLQNEIGINLDIQIRDVYAQALCTTYCDRFVYITSYEFTRDERLKMLAYTAPYYERFTLIINDLFMCYLSFLGKVLADYGYPNEFNRLSQYFRLIQLPDDIALMYRNSSFEITDSVALSNNLSASLKVYDVFYKASPFFVSTFTLKQGEDPKAFLELFLDLQREKLQFIDLFNSIKRL